MGRSFAIVCAVLLHAGFLLFGGLLWSKDQAGRTVAKEVDLISAEELAQKQEEQREEPQPEDPEAIETETEEVPDAAEMLRNLDLTPVAQAPALEAASLSAIEMALSGKALDGGDFAEALGFASGGIIGGTGKPGALDETLEKAFSLAEIDQKPRPVSQAAPLYPASLRSQKLEGVVTVVFVVDASGKVLDPRVTESTHADFEKPALNAIKQWRFEPAVMGGQRVSCRMRVPIRFQPSS